MYIITGYLNTSLTILQLDKKIFCIHNYIYFTMLSFDTVPVWVCFLFVLISCFFLSDLLELLHVRAELGPTAPLLHSNLQLGVYPDPGVAG